MVTSWETFEATLAATLRELPNRGFVVAEAMEPRGREIVVRPRGLFGLVPEQVRTRQPYVQFMRTDDHLAGECIGSRYTEGPYPMTEDEHKHLLALGWEIPWREGLYTLNYAHEWPIDAAAPYEQGSLLADAANVAVRTLRDVFTCPQAGSIRVKTGYRWPFAC